MRQAQNAEKGDPAQHGQQFINMQIKPLCCRYWILKQWDCHNNAFPFWRIYWNRNSGGILELNNEVYQMEADTIYIVAPFTPFNSKFLKTHRYKSGMHVEGRNLSIEDEEADFEENYLIHLFIHFSLGAPFDNVFPGIFKLPVTDYLKERINYITNRLKIENRDFKITFNLKLQTFITEILSSFGSELWKTINIDERVLKSLRYIEKHIDKKLSNHEIADLVNMAPNSFARLFKEEVNSSLHNFIQKRKIAYACSLFEHTDKTIEGVADYLAFSDRYHFSRVFKNVSGITPAAYRNGQFI